MKNQDEIISLLEVSIQNILERYEFLEKENEILSEDNFRVQSENKKLKSEIEFYSEELKMLKIARTLSGEDPFYKNDTKLKIDFLIREIDHCIKKLNR